jgi:hypothetical protein
MTDLLRRIMARYPCAAQRCCEVAAMRVAEEAAALKKGQTLSRSEDDILPSLAQAVRESGVDLTEMARECGVDPIELRRKLALGRVGELLEPGEVAGLSDQELGSTLQQAAREFSLEIGELLDELSCPSPVTPADSVALPMRSRAVRVLWLLRCRMCQRWRSQPYRIDFTPYACGGFRLLREPTYACYRCLPTHLADPQVQAMTRLTEAEIPKSPEVGAWSVAFAAIAVLVVSGVYVHGSGAVRGTRPLLSAGAAPTHLTTASEADLVLVRNETRQSNHPTTAPVSVAVAPSSTARAPSPITARSPVPGIVIEKQTETEALSVLTLRAARRTEQKRRPRGDQSSRQVSDRGIAVNNCRQILHEERPLMRYSIRDTVQDAGHEASVANECARTITDLTENGRECASLFNWFDVFQTRLTNHVKRVCREAVPESTTP